MKALQQRSRGRTKVWVLWDSRRDYDEDFEKMLAVPATCHYLLVFAYPARAWSEWQNFVKGMAPKGINVGISRVDTSPGEELSIGWLHASTQVGDTSISSAL